MRARKIAVITTSRADFGLLYWLLQEIRDDPALTLQLIVSGTHLLPEFENDISQIEAEFPVAERLDMLRSIESPAGIVASIGRGCELFGDSFARLQPDIVVLLGDRFELLAPAIAALTARIPIAHIHGGETSEGAIDEAVRHSITKMACLHFTSTPDYRKRVIQLGENPEHVLWTGAPGLDHLTRTPLCSKEELQAVLAFPISGPLAMVTFHPVTLEAGSAVPEQVQVLMEAIVRSGLQALFTQANADLEGRLITEQFKQLSLRYPARFKFMKTLGHKLYFSCLKHAQMMIGNSSSGLIEAPSFSLPVINIGDRQKGRIRAANVIDCPPQAAAIESAIRTAMDPVWLKGLEGMQNPYAGPRPGTASRLIKETLKGIELGEGLLKKSFFDLPPQTDCATKARDS